MSTTTKSSGAGAQIETFFAEYARTVTKELERLAELRREAFDAATSRNREVINVWTKGVESAVEGYKQTAQAQKDLLEAVAERARVAAKLAAENAESVTKTVAGVIAVFEDMAGYATAAQKQAADFAATQNSTAYAAAQQQFEASGAAAADTFQRGVDTLLETQKIVLGAKQAA